MKNTTRFIMTVFSIGILNLAAITGVNPAFSQSLDEKMLELCNNKNSKACFEVAERYRTLDRDNKKALEYYIKSCDGDWMTACTNAGILKTLEGEKHGDYSRKMKVWKEAGKYFQKACDAEESNACSNMGLLKYKQGRTSSAKKYYKMACDMGNNMACNLLDNLDK